MLTAMQRAFASAKCRINLRQIHDGVFRRAEYPDHQAAMT
jgi:hypothetical protein